MSTPAFKCYSVLLVEKRDGRKKYKGEPKTVLGLLSGRTKKEVEAKCLSEYPNYVVEKISVDPDEVVDTWDKKEKRQNRRHPETDTGQKTEGKSTKKRGKQKEKGTLPKEELEKKPKKEKPKRRKNSTKKKDNK